MSASDVVRIAPLEPGGRHQPVRGFAAIAANAEAQTADVRLEGVDVSEPLVGGDRFALRFTSAETERATGPARTKVKLSLDTVRTARIVTEEVFYFAKP